MSCSISLGQQDKINRDKGRDVDKNERKMNGGALH